MDWRITDKAILLIFTVLMTILTTRGSVVGTDVACILVAVIIFAVTELRRGSLWAAAITVVLIVSSFFVPKFIISAPLMMYGVISSADNKKRGYVIPVKAVSSICLTVAIFYFASGAVMICAIAFMSVAGIYMALKTRMYEENDKILTDKYDEARIASVNARRLGEEIMKNADNEIYTARLKERNRIAREIHDNVGHMITRVIVQMQAIKIINKDENVGKQLESVSETLDLAMTGIRKSVHELHDDSIDLSIGINEITSVIKEKFDVTVKTSIDSPADNNIKNAVLGIIKEAVTNISKYSSGDKVLVEVTENNTFWRVRVWDNGPNPVREFDLSDDSLSDGCGIGLKNIGARAAALKGRASVISGEDGFTVLVTLPKGKDDK